MAPSSPPTSARTADPAPLLTALAGAALLLAAPATADLAAHVYRSGLWERVGLTAWDAQWYGGHHVPGYSVLFPPLGAWLGPRLAGVLAGVGASALFARAARSHAVSDRRAAVASSLFALGIVANLTAGRMPFVLGIALALAAWQARPRWAAAALGAATALASPVAALFLALGGGARRDPVRALVPLAVLVALAGAFPEGGDFPYAASSFWPEALACAVAVPLLRGHLREAALVYLVLLAAGFLFASPVGQNAGRLGTLAGPALIVLGARRPLSARALVACALLVIGGASPALRAVQDATGDPSTTRAFHAELVRALAPLARPGERVEIPFTRSHYEAAYVAPALPLARGWERQLDRRFNTLFYDGRPLTSQRYDAWLARSGVRFVALAAAPLDRSAVTEAALVRAGVPGLRPLTGTAHWRIWERAGAARSPEVEHDPGGFAVRPLVPGAIRVPERWTRYWRVTAGAATLRETPDGYTEVIARQPGRIAVRVRFTGG